MSRIIQYLSSKKLTGGNVRQLFAILIVIVLLIGLVPKVYAVASMEVQGGELKAIIDLTDDEEGYICIIEVPTGGSSLTVTLNLDGVAFEVDNNPPVSVTGTGGNPTYGNVAYELSNSGKKLTFSTAGIPTVTSACDKFNARMGLQNEYTGWQNKEFCFIAASLDDDDESDFSIIFYYAEEEPQPVSKTALKAALDAVPTIGYYKTEDNDKWNGRAYSAIGFWAEMQAVVKTAQDVYNNDTATQDEVDVATASLNQENPNSDLKKAIASLIPDTQLNATKLYEAVRAEQQANRVQSSYTSDTWNTYLQAKSEAEEYLASLFNADGSANTAVNKAANQDDADGYAVALIQATENLYTVASRDAVQKSLQRGWEMLTAMIVLAEQAKEEDYTEESWSAFADKLAEAKTITEPIPTFTAADRATAQELVSRYNELYQAYYCELIPNGAVTITIKCLDPYHVRFKAGIELPYDFTIGYGTEIFVGALQEITLTGTPTLDSALSKVGLSLKDAKNNPYGTKVLVNDVYVTEYYADSMTEGFGSVNNIYSDLILHPGDQVTVIWDTEPLSGLGQTVGYTVATLWQYENSLMAMRFVEDGETIEVVETHAAEPFTLVLECASAALTGERDYGPAEGMAVLVSETQTEPAGNHPTTVFAEENGERILSAEDGRISVTLYEEGWVLLAAFDVEADEMGDQATSGWTIGDYHCTNFGAAIWVHVLPAEDADAVKEQLKEELTAQKDAYPENIFDETDWNSLCALYEKALTDIDAAEDITTARSTQQTAIKEIQAIQEKTLRENEEKPAAFRAAMAKMPEDLALLTEAQNPLVEALIAAYDALTPYQLTLLTESEISLYEEIKALYDAGLGVSASYTLTLAVTADTAEATAAAQAFTTWLRANTATADQIGDVPGVQLGEYGAFQVEYVPQTDPVSAQPLQKIRLAANLNYSLWFLLRDASSHMISGSGWEVNDLEVTLSPSNRSLANDVTGSVTFLFGGVEYEVKGITVEGVDEDSLRWSTESCLDTSTYKGKNKNDVNLYFDETWLEFSMPYQNVTVTVEWQPVSPMNKLEAAYQSYSKSNYLSEDWKNLTAAYEEGKTKIAASEDSSAANAALTEALAAMAAIPPRDHEDPNQLGSVYVTVRNDTGKAADGAAWEGVLVEDLVVNLKQDSTMMSCIAEALTGHTVIGVETGYISSIDGLAEFSCGKKSGWMGTLNDWFTNEGFTQFSVANDKLHDGDVICVEYTCELGLDIRGGTEKNKDTTRYGLELTNGDLSPSFKTGVTEYVFTLESGKSSTVISFTNNNRAFQSRAYLNNYAPSANNWIRSGDTITVSGGDVIYVGVGESVWPAMGTGTPTKYKITIISPNDASGVEKLINAIGSVTYSNYTDKQAAVDLAKAAYEALTDTAKQNVTNYAALTAVEEAIGNFTKVDELKAAIKALPRIVSEADRDDVEAAKAIYDDLDKNAPDLLKQLSVAESNKLLKDVNTFALWDAMAAVTDKTDENGNIDFTSAEANKAETVESKLKVLNANITDVVIGENDFVKAEDGTAAKPKGTEGSYTAAVTFTVGSDPATMVSAEMTIGGKITPKEYEFSKDAGVSSILINGETKAKGSGTKWTAVLPYGSDLGKLTADKIAITPADKAKVTFGPDATDGGKTWTFTVTAEDGKTTADYTLTLDVSKVIVTVLDANVYDVADDTVVTELSPAAVTGLNAIVADKLDNLYGAEEVSAWLELKLKERGEKQTVLTVAARYTADGTTVYEIPDEVLASVNLSVTGAIKGTEYTKVIFNKAYLDKASGSASGITFPVAAAGDYTLIPDDHIATVTWHLNGGTADGVTDGETTIYFRADAGAELPVASRTGWTFKGWHAENSVGSTAYLAVSDQLPADLYAVWQSRNVGATVTVGGVTATKDGVVFKATLPYGSAIPKAADITVTPEDTAATATKPMTGDDGISWTFTVTAEDGTKQEYTLQVVIAEQTEEELLAEAKKTVEGENWDTEQRTANDTAALKTFVEGKLAKLDLGAAYAVTIDSVDPAAAGDEEKPEGTAGSYRFTVTLTAGEKSVTAALAGAISPMEYVAPQEEADYLKALKAVQAYVRKTVPDPAVSSTKGDWAVFALNRGDVAEADWNDAYLKNLKAYVDKCGGVLAEKNYTEYSRVVLALTSMGVDATKLTTDKRTYDLVSPLLDKQDNGDYWAEWQGNNGTAFALLALDSHGYLNNAKGKALRAGLIASLKAKQQPNGSWPISSDDADGYGEGFGDYDVTAAAIYALAPYYLDASKLSALGGTVTHAEVVAMVDDALAFLSKSQDDNGGFGSVEADGWVVIALSTLGRDADKDPDFVKGGKSLLADMLSYFDEATGGFRHLHNGEVNQMSSEQAAYDLAAYDRFKNNKNTLFDMSDVKLASLEEKADQAAADEVEALIDAIGEVTLESKAKIDAARTAYDALTAAQKALVENLATLTAAEAKYKELAANAEQEEVDKAAAKGVDDLIEEIGKVTLDSETAIKAARAAYEKLSETQKALVKNLSVLETAEAKLKELKENAETLATVTFHLRNGVSDEISDGEKVTYTKGDAGKKLPAATRDGYTFQGWFDLPVDGTKYTAVSADLPRDLYAQWESTGSGGSGGSSENTISVTFRLIGAKKADKDVDLGAEEYMPDYVTWIATTAYDMEEGDTVYDLWVLATGRAGVNSVGAEQNYVKTVYAPNSLGGYALSEFTNGKRSGWMYTINGKHPGYGLKEQELHDGDKVVWHYVNDYSYEVADWFEDDSRWPSLGDGRYYNRWLKAPDRFGGAGGGLGEGAQSGSSGDGSGSSGGGSGDSELTPSYDEDTVWLPAEVEHSEGGMAYSANATLDKKTVTEGLEKAGDKSVLKLWVEIEDSNGLVLKVEPDAVKEIADTGAGLRMECSRGVIEINAEDVAKLAEEGKEVRVAISYDDWNDKTRVSVTVDHKVADVSVKIELPARDQSLALAIVNSDGTSTIIKKSAVVDDRIYAEIDGSATLQCVGNTKRMDDVKPEDWFAGAVDFVMSHELMNGVDKYEFAPNDPMTRAMLVTVLYRLEDAPDITGSLDSFGDVKEGSWYADAVAWAAENGIVLGNGEGFDPNGNITREQIATILYRYAKYIGLDNGEAGDMSKFTDGDKVSSWAQKAMAWAVEVGLFKGDDTGSLNPQGNATRAEVATLLERLIKLIVVS